MASSQSHTLGEFIGLFFEDLMKRPIKQFADTHGLFLDAGGPRKTRSGKQLIWIDTHGSRHVLDFVLEKGGTEDVVGQPVAFIELAWRRYTKHSKNKAQEISGAINPICERFQFSPPFKGVILCGQFTDNALKQLRDDGFHVLHIPFEYMTQAFNAHGLHIDFDESTKETDLKKMYAEVTKESNQHRLDKVRETLLATCRPEITQFLSELTAFYNRRIKTITLLPLYGVRTELMDIDEAIRFIHSHTELPSDHKLEYLEVVVTYNNGTFIQGRFKTKDEAVTFLNKIR